MVEQGPAGCDSGDAEDESADPTNPAEFVDRVFDPKVLAGIAGMNWDLPKFDLGFDPKVLAGIADLKWDLPKFDFSVLTASLRELLEELKRLRPPNWPQELDLDDRVKEVVLDDGLPLVWVPRAAVVQLVVAAETRERRVEVLLAHARELMEDCRDALRGVTHDLLAGQQQLAERSVAALEQGHLEAAQALAVVVTETAVSRSFGDKHNTVRRQMVFDPGLVPYTEMRLRAALAPIYRFFTEWNPKSTHPAPEALSRHVTVHQASPSHFTAANSLVAVLLACSVLRALQELEELNEASSSDQQTA